jgi:hypothetical protein
MAGFINLIGNVLEFIHESEIIKLSKIIGSVYKGDVNINRCIVDKIIIPLKTSLFL